MTGKLWRREAFTIPEELHIDKVDAWHLRAAPFVFDRLRSLKLWGYRISLDYCLEKRFNANEKHSTKAGIDDLHVLRSWGPKFSSRLQSLDLQGPEDYRGVISADTLWAVLSNSEVRSGLRSLVTTRFHPSSFKLTEIPLPNLTILHLHAFAHAGEQSSEFIASVASFCPNLKDFLLDCYGGFLLSIPEFKASNYASIAKLPRLEKFTLGDSAVVSLLRSGKDESIRYLYEEISKWRSTCPGGRSMEIKFVLGSLPLEISSVPELAWRRLWPVTVLETVEALDPATEARPRSVAGLLACDFKERPTAHFDLWFRLPHRGLFTEATSDGVTLLCAVMHQPNLGLLKMVLEQTLQDMIRSGIHFDHAQEWSQLSGQEKANDAAVTSACSSHHSSAEIISFVSSDEFPAQARAFVQQFFRPRRWDITFVVVEFYFNVDGLLILLDAGVPCAWLDADGDLLAASKYVLQHKSNLHVISKMWPFANSHATKRHLNNALLKVLELSSSGSRTVPNLGGVVQFFIDKGAVFPDSNLEAVSAAMRSRGALGIKMLRQVIEAVRPEERPASALTAILEATIVCWQRESGVERLKLLLEFGAQLNTALGCVFAPAGANSWEDLFEVTRFLLEEGASCDDEEFLDHVAALLVLEPINFECASPGTKKQFYDVFSLHGLVLPDPPSQKAVDVLEAKYLDIRHEIDMSYMM